MPVSWLRTGWLVAAAALMSAALSACDDPRSTGTKAAPAQQRNIHALRSLPYAGGTEADVDAPVGVTYREANRACPGYSLYTVQMLSFAELIDATGRVVRRWSHEPSVRWERAELLPGGDLVVIGAEPFDWNDGGPDYRIADEARYVLRFDFAGNLKWKRMLQAHHDIEQTPDGNLLLLTFERQRIPAIHAEIPTRVDQLTLLDPNGNVIEQKSLFDAVLGREDIFPLAPIEPSDLGGPPWVDLFHSNSVAWLRHAGVADHHKLYDPRHVLVCFRHQDRIAIFHWDRNEVIWSWGAGELSAPHDAQWLTSGHILLFDNGMERGWSRAVELDPRTNKVVWQWHADPPESFYTHSKGSAQRLPNGNTLLAESDAGRAIEITPAGELVWEFICPHRTPAGQRAAIVRMIRHPAEKIDLLLSSESR